MELIQVQASYKITLSSGDFWSRTLPMHLDRTTSMSELRMVLSENANEGLRTTLGFVVITKVSGRKGKELPVIGLVRDHVENEEVLLLEGRVLSRKDIETDALSWNCRPTASLPQEVAPLSMSAQMSVLDPQLMPALITHLVPALVPQLVAALAPQLLTALGSDSTLALTRNKEVGSKAQEETTTVLEIAETKGAGERKEAGEIKEPIVIKEILVLKEDVLKPLGLNSSAQEQSTSISSVSSSAISSRTPSPASIQPPAQASVSDSDSSSSDSDDEEDDQPTPIDNKRKVEFPDSLPKRLRISSTATSSPSSKDADTSSSSDDSDSDDEDDQPTPIDNEHKVELPGTPPKRTWISSTATSTSSDGTDTSSSSDDSDSDEEDAGKGDSSTGAIKNNSGALNQSPILSPRMNVPPPPITLTELCRRMAAEKAMGSLEQALKREEGQAQKGADATKGSRSVSSRRRGPLEALFD